MERCGNYFRKVRKLKRGFHEQSQVKCSISSKNYETAHFVEMIIQMGSSAEVAGLQYTTNQPSLLSDPQLFRTKDPLRLSFEKIGGL